MLAFLYPIFWLLTPIISRLTVLITCSFILLSYLFAENASIPAVILTIISCIAIVATIYCNISGGAFSDHGDKFAPLVKISIWQLINTCLTFNFFILIYKVFQSNGFTGVNIDLEFFTKFDTPIFSILMPYLTCIAIALGVAHIHGSKNREPFAVKMMFDSPKKHPMLFLHNAFCGLTYLYHAVTLVLLLSLIILSFLNIFLRSINFNFFSFPQGNFLIVILVTVLSILFHRLRERNFYIRKLKFMHQSILMVALITLLFCVFFSVLKFIDIKIMLSTYTYKHIFESAFIHNKSNASYSLFIVISFWMSIGFPSYMISVSEKLSVLRFVIYGIVTPLTLVLAYNFIDVRYYLDAYIRALDHTVLYLLVTASTMFLMLLPYKEVKETFELFAYGLSERITFKRNILEYYKFFFPVAAFMCGAVMFNGWAGILFCWAAPFFSMCFTYTFYLVFSIANLFTYRESISFKS